MSAELPVFTVRETHGRVLRRANRVIAHSQDAGWRSHPRRVARRPVMKVPEVRRYIDPYVRGSNNYAAEERIKLMKLLWDAMGTEFGGRHALYVRRTMQGRVRSRWVDGAGLINPDDVSMVTHGHALRT